MHKQTAFDVPPCNLRLDRGKDRRRIRGHPHIIHRHRTVTFTLAHRLSSILKLSSQRALILPASQDV
ncbi:hypothetical protein VTO42DRAFT_2689 [Malbranchea cinnamomea]